MTPARVLRMCEKVPALFAPFLPQRQHRLPFPVLASLSFLSSYWASIWLISARICACFWKTSSMRVSMTYS